MHDLAVLARTYPEIAAVLVCCALVLIWYVASRRRQEPPPIERPLADASKQEPNPTKTTTVTPLAPVMPVVPPPKQSPTPPASPPVTAPPSVHLCPCQSGKPFTECHGRIDDEKPQKPAPQVLANPCPCGSGKEFRDCHGKTDDEGGQPKPQQNSAAPQYAPAMRAQFEQRLEVPSLSLPEPTEPPKPPLRKRQCRGQREIRVFVSSTFRDMKDEREILVKQVFPELRRLCESRGVSWAEIDLRWGVSDEQKAEGKVLPVCLAEIQRCRPYFIGLLGERYGWVPEQIDVSLIESEEWLKCAQGKSVTELEILHGVLNDPSMAEHALFYFRDPARTPVADCGIENIDKLSALKDRIRGAHSEGKLKCAPRENYPDPAALAELVRADLKALLDSSYPEDETPDPLEREAADHDAFGESRATVYVGRDEDFRILDEHLAGDGQPLVLTGDSGGGKSALLANWVRKVREREPDLVVIEHYIGASPYSVDWMAMGRRLLETLSRELQVPLPIPDQPQALRQALAQGLYRAAAKGRFLLVLDGLNQLEDRDQAPDLVWLPLELPPNARVVMSALPGRALSAVESRGWRTWHVKPLDVAARRQLIVDYLNLYSKQLDRPRVDRLAQAEPAKNPLFLRVVLDELRQWGEHETLDDCIDGYLAAKKPDELYGKVLERWTKDFEKEYPGLVRESMRLLWAAHKGLSEPELLDLLGNPPRAVWSLLDLAAGSALVKRSGQLAFAHDYLRAAVETKYLPKEATQKAVHERVAKYFESRPTDSRKVDELPWQLSRCGEWKRLYETLADLEFFGAAWKRNKYEVMAYWVEVESHTELGRAKAYRGVIDGEVEARDVEWDIARLLHETGHLEPAMAIRTRQAMRFREEGNLDGLQRSLGNQAAILQAHGRLDEAMSLHKEEEHICRQRGNLDSLQCCLGNQAVAHYTRGQLDEAMALLREKQRICEQLGSFDSLWICFGNQAAILRTRGLLDEAMTRLKEQERICRGLGDLGGLQSSMGSQAHILRTRGQLDEAIALHKEQERICRQLGNLDGLQASLGSQALILDDRGQLDEAMALLKEQERICRQLGNLGELQAALGNRAAVHVNRGQLDEAMVLLREKETLCRQLGNRNSLQRCLGCQAAVQGSRGQLNEAMALFKEQERMCRQLGTLDELQYCLGSQAVVHCKQGQLDGASGLLKEKENICRQLGNADGLQECFGYQASICQACGQLDEAMALYKEQERICRQLGKLGALQICLGNQANSLKARGQLDEAMALSAEQERIGRQLGNPRGIGVSLGVRGKILQASGRLDEAMALYKEEEQIHQEIGALDELQDVIGRQSMIHTARGEFGKAMALLKEKERICRQLGAMGGLQGALHNQGAILQAQGRLDEAVPLYKEQESICRRIGELDGLQGSVGAQAGILIARGKFNDAMILLQEMERICRQLSNMEGVQASLNNQAGILQARGQLDDAMTKLKEAEGIGRERSDFDGLAKTLTNQAWIWKNRGQRQEALDLAEQAGSIAQMHGLKAVLGQIQSLVAEIRRPNG